VKEKKRTAYDEAGRSLAAYNARRSAVTRVGIVKFGGRWEGTTRLFLDGIPEAERAVIALAGIAAEALAVALTEDKDATIVVDVAVIDRLEEIMGLLAAEPAVPAWQVDVSSPGLNPIAVSLSRDDVERIPPPQRTRPALTTAMQEASILFNDDVNWAVTRALAKHVHKIAPESLHFFRARLLIEDTLRAIGY